MFYNTRLEKINEKLINSKSYNQLMESELICSGAELLKKGEVVAFPTETVYGLGADATREKAVEKIFKAKGRPQDNPLIVHIADMAQLSDLMKGELSSCGKQLIEAFWPGPLTIIVEKTSLIPDSTTAGLESVAVRMPDHPVARALISVSKLPVAAPSANRSGLPSPTLAEHVFSDLNRKIPLIIDGGPTRVGVESTVIDVRNEKPVILRPGGISAEKIRNVLGFKVELAKTAEKPLSPGMKYRHYSPETPLTLVDEEEIRELDKIIEEIGKPGQSIGLVLTGETMNRIKKQPDVGMIIEMGSRRQPEAIASRLFAILRQLDKSNLDHIFIETIPVEGMGEAVMNRLYKAALKK